MYTIYDDQAVCVPPFDVHTLWNCLTVCNSKILFNVFAGLNVHRVGGQRQLVPTTNNIASVA